jgi:hypothetical protein
MAAAPGDWSTDLRSYAEAMGEKLDRFMNLDIPEELYLSRNIQRMMARAAVVDAPPEEAARAVLAIVAGNVMELEERVVALEKQAGIEPRQPRSVM